MKLISEAWTVTEFKNEIKKRLEPIDTLPIQMRSIIDFMNELGYTPVGGRTSRGFVMFDNTDIHYAPKFISFKNAQIMHNGIFRRIVGDNFDSLCTDIEFKSTNSLWKSANEAKLVKHTYLQKLNKYPYIKATRHVITLVNDDEWKDIVTEWRAREGIIDDSLEDY